MSNRTARISALRELIGVAEQLARLAHLRCRVSVTDSLELDAVAQHLLGPVGFSVERALLWEHLQEPALALWRLLDDDHDEHDLDELTEADWARESFATRGQELMRRYEITRERLCREIDTAVFLARVRASERAS